MPSIIVEARAWDTPADRIEAHRERCLRVFLEGWNVLKNSGSPEDAVEEAIKPLKQNPRGDGGNPLLRFRLGAHRASRYKSPDNTHPL
jgi:isoaspartyl peptidase/L-asparaginase-like protein (Ntn-hydrolase superfamily)